jgi:hypothetical protein
MLAVQEPVGAYVDFEWTDPVGAYVDFRFPEPAGACVDFQPIVRQCLLLGETELRSAEEQRNKG